jgi:hypothetical protein
LQQQSRALEAEAEADRCGGHGIAFVIQQD